MPNEELLRHVINHVEMNNRWNQQTWGGLTNDQFDEDDYVLDSAWENVPAYAINDEGSVELTLGMVLENACSTNFCIAGHTVLLAGDKVLIDRETGEASQCVDLEGNVHLIDARAKSLLDLTEEQADRLFDGDAGNNDLELYKQLVTEATGVTFE